MAKMAMGVNDNDDDEMIALAVCSICPYHPELLSQKLISFRETLIEEFIKQKSASKDVASFHLEATNYNLDDAIALFSDSDHTHAALPSSSLLVDNEGAVQSSAVLHGQRRNFSRKKKEKKGHQRS